MANRERIVVALSTEAYERLKALAIDDNCPQSAIVEHLLMGRMLVEDGHGTVPELSDAARLRARVSELEDTIMFREANDAVARSFGRNTCAVEVSNEIRARRGEEWNGAEIEGLSRI